MILIVYMLVGLGVLTFFIFLFSGEFRNEVQAASDYLFSSTPKKKTAPAPPTIVPTQELEYDEAFQRQLNYVSDLVRIELCVLNAQEEMAKVALNAAANRENY